MRFMLSLFRAYPLASVLMLLALLLSGLAEGLGLSALLPVLKLALASKGEAGTDTGEPDDVELIVLGVLDWLGVSPTLGPLLLLIVVAAALKSILLLLAQRQVGYTAAQLATDLRLDVLRHMMRSRWSFFLHQPAGRLTNTMASEAQRASDAYVNGATAITFLIQSLAYVAVALAVSWKAVSVSLVAGVVVIGGSHFLVRMTRRAARKQTRLMTSLMSRLTDTLQSVKPLKAMAREHLADRVLNLETNQLNKSLRRQVFSAAVLDSAQQLMFTAFIALGIYVALSWADMALPAVMVLVVTVGRGFNFLSKVQKQYQKLHQGESAYWSLLETIDEARRQVEPETGSRRPALQEGIRFEQVRFAYDEVPVFTDLTLDVPVHAMTTLIGPSGVGKTTIIDLVIGLLRPDGGEILVDGVPLQELDVRAWRSMIGYVPQDTVLLHDSIRNNVTLSDPEVSELRVEQALKDAGAWGFVRAFPDGLDTVVGERGGRLSGGQRQRIAIARALVNNPELLILDEATSALDPASEEAILNTLASLRRKLTILAISHNQALADAADRVYRLEPGGCVELLDASTP
jgi:ATP-binding cassette subfamily C protein